jgi:hypothetical protein
MKQKLRTYAILTSGSNRVEVKARNVEEAYRKAKKDLAKFNAQGSAFSNVPQNLTSAYMTFGRTGINLTGWISTQKSVKMKDRYKLIGV